MNSFIETTDLSCFKSQELARAAKILKIYGKEGADWLEGKVSLCVNVRNRNVYLVDESINAAMLDTKGRLQKWWWCSICNVDGFDGEVHIVNSKHQRKEFEKYDGYCSADCQQESEN